MPIEIDTKVKEIIQRTFNVKSVRLEVKDWIDFKAGQFLCASLKTEKECKRYLSISSSPTEKGYIEFTKKITESEFSKIVDKLKPGDFLNIKYPFGNFTLDSQYKKIAFLSGGIGITPVRSITKYVIDKKMDIAIVIIYGNHSIKDIVFKDDFDIMETLYPKLKVIHTLSKPDIGWSGNRGYINNEIIKEEIPDYEERVFYISGPPLMVEAMQKIITEELKVSKERVIVENFIGY